MKRAILIAVCAAAVAFGSVGCSSGGVRDAMYDEGIEVYNIATGASKSMKYDKRVFEKVDEISNKYSNREDLTEEEDALLKALQVAALTYMANGQSTDESKIDKIEKDLVALKEALDAAK